jgi:cytoskeletal protein CcmA (bactofilin family)
MATNVSLPLGSTLVVKGELIARENIIIEGTIEGAVTVEGFELTTGKNARVNAAITAKAVTVHGHLKGHITADIVDVLEGANVEANVITKKFALDDGALFNGSVNTERARAAGQVARHRLATPDS